jgi:branched-chain amino acid transport system substrate-binding protein
VGWSVLDGVSWRSRRRRLQLVVSTVLAVVACSCGPGPGPAGPVLQVGLVTSLSGLSGPLGVAQQRGAEVAVRQLGGRIANHPLAVAVRDDQGDPAKAATAARQLVASGARALVGCTTETVAQALDQAAAAAGVPYLAICPTVAPLAPPAVHLSPTWRYQAGPIMAWVVANLGRTLMYSSVKDDAGIAEYQAVATAAGAAGARWWGVTLWPRSADFRNDRLLDPPDWKYQHDQGQVDVVVLALDGQMQEWQLQAAGDPSVRDRNGLGTSIKLFVLHVDQALDQEVGFDGVAVTEGATTFVWTVEDPPSRRFVTTYLQAYGEPPGAAAASAYNAVMLLADQMKAGALPADLGQALAGRTYQLAGGPLSIRPCDRQALQPVYIVTGQSRSAAGHGSMAQYAYRTVAATLPPPPATCPVVEPPASTPAPTPAS